MQFFTRMFLLLVAAILTLSACTTTKTATTPGQPVTQAGPQQSWEARKTALSRIQNWQINGKIAIQTTRDSGSATINWEQAATSYRIALYAPLGSGNLTLNGRPGLVTMQASDGKKAQAASAEQLLAQQWGWRLPVSNLKYWVRGLPVPGMPTQTQFDNQNRLNSLVQQGWVIQYQDYATYRGLDLPKRIAISSPTFKTKIVIYNWSI